MFVCCGVQVLETYPNLGPIIDFCVVDLDRQGQVGVRHGDLEAVSR